MAIYQMTNLDLAKYLSSTQFLYMVENVTSTKGQRIVLGGSGSYEIEAKGISHETVIPKLDCFINEDESIAVTVYVPAFTFRVVTKELSKSYGSDTSLSFTFYAPANNFTFELTELNLKHHKDFTNIAQLLIEQTKKKLEEVMNDSVIHNGDKWNFKGVSMKIDFSVTSMAN